MGTPMTTEDFRNELGEAYQLGYRRTRGRLRKMGVRDDQAEDLVQSAYLRGLQRHDQLRDKTRLPAWIDAIATNGLRNTWREARLDQLQVIKPKAVVTSGINIDALDLKRVLEERCTLRQRQLTDLIYSYGFSATEAAQRLGITVNAVYSDLARARRTIRKHMSVLPVDRRDLTRHRAAPNFHSAKRLVVIRNAKLLSGARE